MDKIYVKGGSILKGNVKISGAKNSALPIMAACLISDEDIEISNIPKLADIETMKNLLENHGTIINQISTNSYKFNSSKINNLNAPYDIVRKMRASFWVLGPLLAKYGKASVSLPGGCAIGVRPVDMHLMALGKMGAEIKLEHGYVNAKINGKLKGAIIDFDKISVGATVNIMTAACLADGETIIKNAACEPEIVDLANFLITIGADIKGAGTNEIRIIGQEKLKGGKYSIIDDRIEAATYAIAAIATNGHIKIETHTSNILLPLEEFFSNSNIKFNKNGFIEIDATNCNLKPAEFMTEPFPGFPTDIQAQFMSMLTQSEGISKITETIYENRFIHVPELKRMGANIEIQHNTAIIKGKTDLIGCEVMATDLRASASLIIAALCARGETIINRVYHLDRGYEKLEEKFTNLGAIIERISGHGHTENFESILPVNI